MPNEYMNPQHDSAGAWAKRYHLASRQMMESLLRRYDLGVTQWYVLYQLATAGPTAQRELVRILGVERATLTGVVAALVRKGFVEQAPDIRDQRQKILTITASGASLWRDLPDPIDHILDVAFADVPEADLDTTVQVLRQATDRLHQHLSKGNAQ
ncbi:MarR family transcriptional regulator [Mycobacterium sp. 236(2023)]|uniref:MarR family winged helix-turn-helix transcriptional regulator n=1 Tax=Mycobacterium sp. 236(2023) TaxID=3038163 RepID=UPI002414EF68|nr:MarR family transcriptional regulator [Mycobacterium sp. 236(2023)]MDG4668026.1 MarR family transcriptional regulator [Mycobacterium sp. 236(2023)]